MNDIEFRLAIRNDLDEVVSLSAMLYEEGREATPTPEKANEIYARIQRYPDYRIYLAESGGKTIGT
ncbi:MAG: hypothetical protein GY771_13425, partial [bacterium]|nr:hypothetical protein [bacterium]